MSKSECPVCGKPCPEGKAVCSDRCERVHALSQQEEKRVAKQSEAVGVIANYSGVREPGKGGASPRYNALNGVRGQRYAEYLGTLVVDGRPLTKEEAIKVLREIGFTGQKSSSLAMRFNQGQIGAYCREHGEEAARKFFSPCADMLEGTILPAIRKVRGK